MQKSIHLYPGESPEVQHAYITIAELFGSYSLSIARQNLEKLLKRAGSYHYWRGDPSNVLFFFEKLEGLVLAAPAIHQEEGQRKEAVIVFAQNEVPALTACQQYCG